MTERAVSRSFFYVGGRYVPSKNASDGHVKEGQMYVERLVPIGGATHETPIILIHGLCQTGTNWLNKPDGGVGWASRFVEQGYEVYIVDQPSSGRSYRDADLKPPLTAEFIQDHFTATSRKAGTESTWPQGSLHTQWPGPGIMGDPIFDEFYATQVGFNIDNCAQEKSMRETGAALLDKLGKERGNSWKGAVLVGHSQGGSMPMVIADARPRLVAALVLLEPRGPPFRDYFRLDRIARPYGMTESSLEYMPPIESDPTKELITTQVSGPRKDTVACYLQSDADGDPSPRKLVNLLDKPILIVTSESSYHAMYDWAMADFLKQAGCSLTEHIELGDIGIHGNGHMFFLEKNSDEIQKVLERWIQSKC